MENRRDAACGRKSQLTESFRKPTSNRGKRPDDRTRERKTSQRQGTKAREIQNPSPLQAKSGKRHLTKPALAMPPTPAIEKLESLLQKATTNNTMTLEGYEHLRTRAAKNTGWSTRRVDAWIAETVEVRHIKVGITFPRIGTKLDRDIVIAAAPSSHLSEQATTKWRVVQWIKKRCGTKGPTSAHIQQMKTGLRQGAKCPVIQIEATLALLAAEEGVTMEGRVQGRLKQKRDWIKEAVEWAITKGWRLTHPHATTLTLAKRRIKTRGENETAMVELGSGWLGATEGLQRVVTRVIQQDEKRQTLARVKGKNIKAAPDILAKFQAANPAWGPVIAAAKTANVNLKEELVGAWVSPSCKNMSTAQGFQKGKREAKGPAAGRPIPREDTQAITAIVQGIEAMTALAPASQWAIENPERSAMWKMPQIKHLVGKFTTKVHGCAYGRKSGKTYKIAMSREAHAIFKPIHPTDARSKCEHCKRLGRTKHKEHEQAACPAKEDPRPRISEAGQVGKGAVNRVPPALAEHVGKAMLQAWQEKASQHG